MSSSLSKRLFAGLAAASLGLAVTACGGGEETASGGGSTSSGSEAAAPAADFDDKVTVGILHSLTGTMAISESTLVDTEKMAIDEINAAGGVVCPVLWIS
jgi:urea transport system substrate-binding protein